MQSPPPLPQVKPPPLPQKKSRIPTAVYSLLFIILFAVNAVWTYQQAFARFPDNSAAALGYLQGGLIAPLAVAAGVACIWKQNRGVRGVIRVLFWASLILLFLKISQLANSPRLAPNQPAAGDTGIAPRLTVSYHWPDVPERDR